MQVSSAANDTLDPTQPLNEPTIGARGLLESAPDAMVTINHDGYIVLVNSQTERLFGYPRDELLGQPVELLLPDHLRAVHESHRARYMSDPYTRPMGIGRELSGRRKDGTLFPVEISLSPLETQEGLFVSAIIRDITERKRAEEALRRAEEKFRGLLESAPDPIVVSGRDGRIQLVNSQAEQVFGYGGDELIGQPVEVLLPERLRDLHAAHRDEYYAHPRTRPIGIGLELRARRKDGSTFPVEISLSPLHSEGEMLVTAVVRDITERKQAEERLRFLSESSKLLAASLDYETTLQIVARLAVPALADWCVVDLTEQDGSIRQVAAAHADPLKEAVLRELRAYLSGRRDLDFVAKVLSTGEAELHAGPPDSLVERLDGDIERANVLGQLFAGSFMCVPMLVRERKLGALSVAAPLSGRYGEADLALAEELARRAALAIENARLYGEAQEAIRMRNEFLAIVTHDLKNPMGAIHVYTDLARMHLKRTEAPDAGKGAEILSKIDATVEQMTDQLNELLDIARLQMGSPLELTMRPVDLVDLARQVAGECGASSRRHTIRMEFDTDRLVVRGDALRLRRVLVNLLANAIKYSPKGGDITLEVRQEEDPNGPWAALRVSDQGMGIPAADLPRIFTRFHRAGNVIGRISGTGIGLASARQIVEQHGGKITVVSEEGVGSTFTVRLPLAG